MALVTFLLLGAAGKILERCGNQPSWYDNVFALFCLFRWLVLSFFIFFVLLLFVVVVVVVVLFCIFPLLYECVCGGGS